MLHAQAPAADSSLSAWLSYLERLHPTPIELGLERVAQVRDRLGLSLPFPLITVGGTNGKGSTCAFLEAILRAAGYRVGCYTSPHLIRYNERVRICGRQASDAQLAAAFARVEAAREGTSLTYFEFGTLAAGVLFCEAHLDVAVMEVGLGGRLDAVNLFDPDCAVVTTVGLDHLDYLGPTREHIGFEKAGIFRRDRPAVVGDSDPPASLVKHAREVGAQLQLIDRDFGARSEQGQWTYWSAQGRRAALPWPALRGDHQLANAVVALCALECMHGALPIDAGAIRRGLVEVQLPGRFQVLPGRPIAVLDVAHNAHAAERLRESLARMGRYATTCAVFGMLKDKDIAGVARAVAPVIDRWLIAPLPGARGAGEQLLREQLRVAGVTAPVDAAASIAEAYRLTRDRTAPDDRIVVFGSFLTVGAVLALTERVSQ
jgi:dihydrofolate synthase/folylpolyglutamate synthase